MERVNVICLQTILFVFTCSVMSQVINLTLSNSTSFTKEPWYHSSGKEGPVMRQGINEDDANKYKPKTEAPPPHSCICSKIYDPVCASNNESYFNLCFLECKVSKSENVTVIHQGNCIPF